ncbi:hypothetical protein [Streptomyces radicis]|uniref:hypothetical protein n=1 Tax=Streptomyces radicis TaxID=1750517 RepID=UPI0016021552|nr:hypothetical protein [Streptomyces radicis]
MSENDEAPVLAHSRRGVLKAGGISAALVARGDGAAGGGLTGTSGPIHRAAPSPTRRG